MKILWPAFLMSIVAEGIFFSMIDPQELEIVGIALADSRAGAYTVTFFIFWILFTVSSAMTWMLTRERQDNPAPKAPRSLSHHDGALSGS